eukprot:CAMPEP_0114349708 /NCGR_PEP_ID=MMETSP0101-20121206/15753_1 /TAXON_ID=38822 ORGANISM="Pteridomonas danica, Strain PT" /NCGR_SAMPLE_ID=MMETSP0101 /ASSEMBLY_ACC=CAM_ASM_000211 /LENGTH=450 /DNA_ID=CAMNT_0001488453 /DNA_START=194 /DNA_END=1546 /DNA_ORIENTATION=+
MTPFEPEPTDRRVFCEELLTDGLVQSFVDFFYLTHRPDPQHAAAHGTSSNPIEIQVPPNEMSFIRENLTSAENARRQGDTGTVYGAYSSLATHYQEGGDSRTGVYFYQKCLEIAKLTGDNRGEMSANHDLGIIHFAMGDAESAAHYHERHVQLAGKEDNEGEQRIASGELVKVYRAIAEGHESNDLFDQAVQYYSKCLESSILAKERRSEGLASYRLGRCFVLLNDCARAIEYLEEYETSCKALEDKEGEGAACAALASAYTSLQNDEKALAYLKSCLDIAYETENMVAQGEACCALGVIYNKRNEFDKAVDFFERNFEIARVTAKSGRLGLKEGSSGGGIASGGGGIVASGGSSFASSTVRSMQDTQRPNTSDKSGRPSGSGGGGGSDGGSGTALLDIARCYVGMARGNAMLKRYVHIVNVDTKRLLYWKTKRILDEGRSKRSGRTVPP